MRETKYKIFLKCKGLKRRERKVKHHNFTELGYLNAPVGEFDIEKLKVRARAWLKENMKEYTTAHIDLEKVEHERDERGTFMEYWSPFGEGHIRGVEI